MTPEELAKRTYEHLRLEDRFRELLSSGFSWEYSGLDYDEIFKQFGMPSHLVSDSKLKEGDL